MNVFREESRKKVIVFYTFVFYALSIFKFWQGLWLFQAQPFVFKTRFDGTSWYFMQTGLHQWLIVHPQYYWIPDALFYSIPLVYFIVYTSKPSWLTVTGVLMLIINWMYVQLYVLYPTNSIEAHVGWLLFPIVLMIKDLQSFWLMLSGMRYYILFFFGSAGLWKLYGGGVFHLDQMSNVLLLQHKDLLVTSANHLYTQWIKMLITHPNLSWSLYASATILELSFIGGFFTKRFDKLLCIFALLFIIMDKVVMNMYYIEILPLIIPLLFSMYKEPVNKANPNNPLVIH